MKKNFIIIGSGVAAIHAAKAIRDHDQENNILVFGEENLLPYNRMKLSKELYSDLYSVKNQIKKEKWFEKNNITFFQNTKVEEVNTENKAVITSNGERISYEKLLLCTGASNRKLPIEGVDKEGVFTVRNIRDTDALKAYVEDKKHIVLIGGGVQNLEIAWSLLQAGKKVSIIEVTQSLMGRQLDFTSSALLKRKIEENGAAVYTSAQVHAIKGEEFVTGVLINNNQLIHCDAVVYSIGIVPNTKLAENTALKVNKGIVVNEKMETNVVSVYAAGDAAELPGEISGLWASALEQGKIAGNNMAAFQQLSYSTVVPTTILQAFGLALFSIGCVDEKQCDETIIEDKENMYTTLFIKNNQIIGVISFEGIDKMLPYKLAIEQRKPVKTESTKLQDIIEQLK